MHLLTTATAVLGASRFDRTFARSPITTVLLFLFVVVPLGFHAGYGGWLAIMRPRAAALPGWMPRLRMTASLTTLAFLLAHFIELPLRGYTGSVRSESLYDLVSAHLSSTWHGIPVVALGYLAGVAATIVHFSFSLWALVPGYGLILSVRGRAYLAGGLAAGAVALFLTASNTIVYLATGSRLLGSIQAPGLPDGPPRPACSTTSPNP